MGGDNGHGRGRVSARRLLRRASIRARFVALPLVAAAVTAANLVALYLRMAVNDHDAALVGVLLCYSLAAGLAVALVFARTTGPPWNGSDRRRPALGDGDLTRASARSRQDPTSTRSARPWRDGT